MLFANAVFNNFTGCFDVTNCVSRVLGYVRQNVAVVLLFQYSIVRYELMFVSFRMVLCEITMLLFVFRIMLFVIRVFRELDRYMVFASD